MSKFGSWLVFVLGTLVYWPLATFALLAILMPCGLGPEADCEMASPITFWLAAAGLSLIYVSFVMRLRIWKRK